KVVRCFALAGDGLNVSRIVPGHEDFVSARGVAKYLRPAPGGLLTLLLPKRAKFGIERLAMSLKIIGQLWGHGGGKGLVGSGGVVASVAENADFVLNLHHDDRVVAAVDLAKVLHNRGEGPRVRVACGIGIAGNGAKNTGFVVAQHDARKAFGVLLDPNRRVAGQTVLPGSQPQEDNADVLLARLRQQ